jgi:hypothetical protein
MLTTSIYITCWFRRRSRKEEEVHEQAESHSLQEVRSREEEEGHDQPEMQSFQETSTNWAYMKG